MDQFTQIRHTMIRSSIIEDVSTLKVHPVFEEHDDMVASNRIDAIIARAYHLSRSRSFPFLLKEWSGSKTKRPFLRTETISPLSQG